MTLLDDIKKIIKEEKNKNGILLEAGTRILTKNERPPEHSIPAHSKATVIKDKTMVDPDGYETEREPDTQVDSDKPSRQLSKKDIRPGFNLYHGVMTQAFTELQSMTEDGAGEIVRKVTQWALMKSGESLDVFQGENKSDISPQLMATIIQKSMLVILNHVASEASKEATEAESFSVADA